MTNFIPIPPHNYAAELLREAPQFSTSTEYRSLNHEEHNFAGVVFAAFTRFMEAWIGNHAIIDECAQAIEHFALSNDSDAHNLLITEVFENFRCPDISSHLLLRMSRALYERWIIGPEGHQHEPQNDTEEGTSDEDKRGEEPGTSRKG